MGGSSHRSKNRTRPWRACLYRPQYTPSMPSCRDGVARVLRAKHSPADRISDGGRSTPAPPMHREPSLERLTRTHRLQGDQGGDDVALGPRLHQAAIVLSGDPAAHAIDALEPGA